MLGFKIMLCFQWAIDAVPWWCFYWGQIILHLILAKSGLKEKIMKWCQNVLYPTTLKNYKTLWHLENSKIIYAIRIGWFMFVLFLCININSA